MNSSRRQLLAALALAACAAPAIAQDGFPSRPVSIVVPFPAGGVVDVIARTVGQKMSAELGTAVIIENKPGAGGTIGAAYVAKAKPDGYTILLGGSATQVFGPALYSKLQYDAQRDFEPVGQISAGPLVLVTGGKTPAGNVQELLAYLQDRGGRAFYGSNGNGTFPHLAAELLKQSNGLEAAHIPYSGGPAVVTALASGEVAFSINHIPVVQGLVRSGKLRALATTGEQRSTAFPDVPTMEEAGIKGVEANAWWGLFTPAGVQPDIVAKLSDALAAALRNEGLRKTLTAQGEEVSFKNPQDFAAYVDTETRKWTQVVKAAKLQLD